METKVNEHLAINDNSDVESKDIILKNDDTITDELKDDIEIEEQKYNKNNTNNNGNDSTNDADGSLVTASKDIMVTVTEHSSEGPHNKNDDIKLEEPLFKDVITNIDPNDVSQKSLEKFSSAYIKSKFDYMAVLFWGYMGLLIGFSIFILSNLWWIMLLFTGVGVVISGGYEYIKYRKIKQETTDKLLGIKQTINNNGDGTETDDGKQDKLNAIFGSKWEENPDKHDIYVYTKFEKSYIEEYTDNSDSVKGTKNKRKVQVTGCTRAYREKGTDVLTIERRALYTFQDYKGYEIGGGLSSLIGMIASISAAILKNQFGSANIFEWMGIVIVLTALFGCVGCVIEIELRKKNILPPNKKIYRTSSSIPLHDIISVDTESIGYHENVKADIILKAGGDLMAKKFIIAWFNSLLGICKFIKHFILSIFINTAFVLLILISIIVILLFYLNVTKGDGHMVGYFEFYLFITLLVTLLICIFGLYYLSKSVNLLKDKGYFRLSFDQRMAQDKQKIIFILLAIVTGLVFLSAIFMGVVSDNIYDWKPDKSATTANTVILQSMTNCNVSISDEIKSARDARSKEKKEDGNFGLIYTSNDICSDSNNALSFVAFICMCIACYVVTITAYLWRKWDLKEYSWDKQIAKKYKRIYKHYGAIDLGLKRSRHGSRFFKIFNFSESVRIELFDTEIQKLQTYLNKNVPYFKVNDINCSTKYVYNS